MAGEKRVQEREESLLTETVILVDIEGTTTSISFVKETLFPYIRDNLKEYIQSKWDDNEFKEDIEKLKEQAKNDEKDNLDGFTPIGGANSEEEKESILKNVFWQMDHDRKTGALKQLQGHMWREAYNSGAVKGHIYEDVPKALESWTSDGRQIFVYSSGSVQAQKLLFGHSVHGDLLKYFSDFFDTEVGAKQEPSSYKNILTKIGTKPSNVLFLTDIVKEAEAAKEEGLSAMIVLREGNATLTDEEKATFPTIKSFSDLTFQASAKRQKLEDCKSEEKIDKVAGNVTEAMDTSEDVEMADVSEKKSMESVTAKEVTESEKNGNPESSAVKNEESMVTEQKDTPIKNALINQLNVLLEENSKSLKKVSQLQEDNVENVSSAAVEITKTAESASEVEANKSVSTEKALETVAVAIKKETKSEMETCSKDTNSTIIEPKEPKAEPEKILSTAEKKPDELTKPANDAQSENVLKADGAIVESKPVNENTKMDTKQVNTEDKAEVNSSTVERTNLKNDDSIMKTLQEAIKSEDTPSENAAKNGEAPIQKAENSTTSTITEAQTVDSKPDAKEESKDLSGTDAGESVVKISQEKDEEKVTGPNEGPTVATEGDGHDSSVDKTKRDTSAEPVKEETLVEEVKENNTVDSEKKKLNGNAQNGETDVPVSDDNLHRNGLNEESTSQTLSTTAGEDIAAQNGNPQSSSDASTESIKVKKVVDSTVADGAGEPDVVPPVVVAATS